MKKNDIVALRSLSKDELLKKVSDLQAQMRSVSLRSPYAAVKNVHELRSLKKDLAQVLTVLNARSEDK